jgi:hypothetical protein
VGEGAVPGEGQQGVRRGLKKAAMDFVMSIGKETTEEGVQEAIGQSTKQILTRYIEPELEDERASKILTDAAEQMKESVGPLAFLMLPGGAVRGINEEVQRMAQDRWVKQKLLNPKYTGGVIPNSVFELYAEQNPKANQQLAALEEIATTENPTREQFRKAGIPGQWTAEERQKAAKTIRKDLARGLTRAVELTDEAMQEQEQQQQTGEVTQDAQQTTPEQPQAETPTVPEPTVTAAEASGMDAADLVNQLKEQALASDADVAAWARSLRNLATSKNPTDEDLLGVGIKPEGTKAERRKLAKQVREAMTPDEFKRQVAGEEPIKLGPFQVVASDTVAQAEGRLSAFAQQHNSERPPEQAIQVFRDGNDIFLKTPASEFTLQFNPGAQLRWIMDSTEGPGRRGDTLIWHRNQPPLTIPKRKETTDAVARARRAAARRARPRATAHAAAGRRAGRRAAGRGRAGNRGGCRANRAGRHRGAEVWTRAHRDRRRDFCQRYGQPR